MKSFQQKDCFAAIPGKHFFFFPTMQEFINRITVGLESHLKMHLYNIFTFPAEESRQGSFIPIPSAKQPVPEGSSARGPPGILQQCHKGGPPGMGPYLHHFGPLSQLQGKRCLAALQATRAQNVRAISQRTTMLLGSMDSTASRNLNCTCWYSRWCSNVKYCTPLLVSTSCMAIPREHTDVGTADANL